MAFRAFLSAQEEGALHVYELSRQAVSDHVDGAVAMPSLSTRSSQH
jgi:hypothetical protein